MKPGKIYIPQGGPKKFSWTEAKSLHQTLDMAKSRILVVCSIFVLTFLIIAGRLVDVSLLRGGGEESFVHAKNFKGHRFRANIVDCNGEILATSLRTSSLYANARVILDAKEAAKQLLTVLPELKLEETVHRLQSKKGFVWIARHLTPQKQADIIRLGIPGIYFQRDERRVYPHGSLFAHVLGFTDIDNFGLAGIERKFDERLQLKKEPLQLSLDLRVQHILRDELFAGVEKYKARGGSGIIMNVQTGEVVAMVSLPDFDLNQVNKIGVNKDILFNRITLGVYELGSSLKILNTALYLESGLADVSKCFDVSAPLKVGRFKITDYPKNHFVLTVGEIFTKSSNIGAAKMALQMGSSVQKEFFNKLGFFSGSDLEVPENGSPLYPKQWTDATTITASYGYGIAISPLQLVTAIAGVINKGVMKKPTLLKVSSLKAHPGFRIVSKETSEIMCKLMYMVVAQGTGRKAQVKGYEVGGKTGTANVVESRAYKKGTNMTSFVGAFPMSNPQYIVFIMVDRPQGIKETHGFNAAGWNAAPITGKVIERIAPLLQVAPTDEGRVQPEENPMLIHVSSPQGKGY